jgi:hypothetical protein
MNPPTLQHCACGGIVIPAQAFWWGSAGPFCSAACREAFITKSNGFVDNVRHLVMRGERRAPPPVATLPETFKGAEARIARENAQRQVMLCMDALSRAGELVIRCAGELAELDVGEELRGKLYALRGTPSVVSAIPILGAIPFDELRDALAEHRKARADLDVAVEHARKVGIT